MKKLFIIIFLLSSYIGMTQSLPISEKTGEVSIFKILELPELSKEQIYSNTKRWIAINFKDSQEVIQLDNKEDGLIICKAVFTVSISSFGQKPGGHVYYDLIFQIRDNRMRVEVTNVYHSTKLIPNSVGSGGNLANERPECGSFMLPMRNWNDIKEQSLVFFESITSDIEKNLLIQVDDDW